MDGSERLGPQDPSAELTALERLFEDGADPTDPLPAQSASPRPVSEADQPGESP